MRELNKLRGPAPSNRAEWALPCYRWAAGPDLFPSARVRLALNLSTTTTTTTMSGSLALGPGSANVSAYDEVEESSVEVA